MWAKRLHVGEKRPDTYPQIFIFPVGKPSLTIENIHYKKSVKTKMSESKSTKSLSALVANRTITNIKTKTETNKPKLILEGFLMPFSIVRDQEQSALDTGYLILKIL